LDAEKRWEDKPEKFSAWLEQFYKSDHRAFIQRAFGPVAELFDERVQQLIDEYCDEHGELIVHTRANKIDLTTFTQSWLESVPELQTDAILSEENDDE